MFSRKKGLLVKGKDILIDAPDQSEREYQQYFDFVQPLTLFMDISYPISYGKRLKGNTESFEAQEAHNTSQISIKSFLVVKNTN